LSIPEERALTCYLESETSLSGVDIDADTDLLESIVRLLRLLDCPRDLSCAWSDGGP
jgi:hypothetical protein